MLGYEFILAIYLMNTSSIYSGVKDFLMNQ